VTLAIVMLLGRFMMAIPALAIAARSRAKKSTAASAGTFPTDGIPFVVPADGVIVIVGALTFFCAVALGPIVEQLLMTAGKLFLGLVVSNMSDRKAPALWNREIVSRASIESFTKLDPRKMIRNP